MHLTHNLFHVGVDRSHMLFHCKNVKIQRRYLMLSQKYVIVLIKSISLVCEFNIIVLLLLGSSLVYITIHATHKKILWEYKRERANVFWAFWTFIQQNKEKTLKALTENIENIEETYSTTFDKRDKISS